VCWVARCISEKPHCTRDIVHIKFSRNGCKLACTTRCMTNFQLTIQKRYQIRAPIWRPDTCAFCVLAGVEVSDRYYIVGEIRTGSPNDETPWLPNKEMTKLY
jgi:hypothetical protein